MGKRIGSDLPCNLPVIPSDGQEKEVWEAGSGRGEEEREKGRGREVREGGLQAKAYRLKQHLGELPIVY